MKKVVTLSLLCVLFSGVVYSGGNDGDKCRNNHECDSGHCAKKCHTKISWKHGIQVHCTEDKYCQKDPS